jgi:hypothetical protein
MISRNRIFGLDPFRTRVNVDGAEFGHSWRDIQGMEFMGCQGGFMAVAYGVNGYGRNLSGWIWVGEEYQEHHGRKDTCACLVQNA